MLIGSALLITCLGVRLATDKIDAEWIGALMAASYLGLVSACRSNAVLG